MGFLDRYRRLPYLEPEKQRFLALELVSMIIIGLGCVTLLLALVYETSQGGIDGPEAIRILNILSGFFIVIIGLSLLLVFMYRHVSALEGKLDDLRAPKEPKAYEGAVGATGYVEKKHKEQEEAEAREAPTEEEIRAGKVREAKELANRMEELEKAFDEEGLETTYHKCAMCGALFTEDWDTCSKCGARLK